VSIAKKVVGTSADQNVIGSHAQRVQSRRLHAMLRTPWPWPRAVMAIIVLSLVLWGVVAGIVLVAFH